MLAVWTLWKREMVRFFRQRSRVIGAFGSPILFWILIGSGMGTSFQGSSQGQGSYLYYFFPGTLYLILLFTAIFSTISLIEDRREGFLQGVLVAPVPRSALVLGKMLGGATLALIQAILFLAITPWLGMNLAFSSWMLLLVIIFINAFALTGLGLILAWNMRSIQGFHAIMNLLLMPAWLLSGALFPAHNAHPVVQTIMFFNPLSYGLEATRSILNNRPAMGAITVTLFFSFIVFFLANFAVKTKNIQKLL